MQVIIYLDTGAGKTLVAALLAKHQIALHQNLSPSTHDSADAGQGSAGHTQKRVFCLVPTTILVAQQAAVFRQYVAQSIGEYTGDMGVDAWEPDKWRQEIEYAATPPFSVPSSSLFYVIVWWFLCFAAAGVRHQGFGVRRTWG